MEHADVVLVDVQVLQVVQLLQDEMAGVEQHGATGVGADAFVEHLERDAVMQVFAGVNLEAQVHALLVAGVQHRQPAAGQFIECRLDQALGPLREREQARAEFSSPCFAQAVLACGLPRACSGAKLSTIAS
ncbi:hypothetical protein G6F31_020385 [Rhizopus arrhizus]|nr:hypothetical protein G6F31_020385 [Rhizopus arrhizus]